MRKLLLLFAVMTLLPLTSVLSQVPAELILEQRGDSIVIKDDVDYAGQNTLYTAMNAEVETMPEGRVYILRNGGYYSLVNNPTSSATVKTIIMGEDQSSVKTSQGAPPPVVAGAVGEGINTTGGISSGNDLLVKNVNISIANSGGAIGWAFFGFSGPGLKIEIENCIIEHTWWAVIGGPPSDEVSIFRNNYFVNLVGHTCRRNGGVVDFNSGTTQDTLIVENNTHVNVQGSMYKSRTGYTIKRQIFNHNTFVNCCGYVFMNTGDHTDFSVTNNVFVNCNVQPYSPSLDAADVGETDPGQLPMGLVNVLDDSAFSANGETFYVDKNLVYWDPSLSDIVQTVNDNAVNGVSDWTSQMITMNSRSQAMFNDNATYPYLSEGEWINKLPNFVDTDVLFTDQLETLKEFAIATVDVSFTGDLAMWRQPENPATEYFTFADWPVPINLAYDDADLLTAGLNGFPLGDLDWFPTQKAAWEAQKADEYAQIHQTLYTGLAVRELPGLALTYQLSQNYPNPFNPSTVINFTIPQPGNVTLKVYNSVGQEVATLLNEYKAAKNYSVDFNASNLASGVYFYKLQVNNFTQTRKMMLIK